MRTPFAAAHEGSAVLRLAQREGTMAGSEPTSLFDSEPDAALEARLDEAAEASYAAGRFVEHETVVRWLMSWGTEDELPPPAP